MRRPLQYARVTGPLAPAAQYQRARALIASGNTPAARQALQSLASSYATDTSSASALLLLADLASDDGRDSDARATLLGLIKRFPSGRHSAIARFRAALTAYIAGDFRAASSEMDSLVRRDPESTESLAAAYWSGRALARIGDKPGAATRWRGLIAKDPLSYYAVMSAKRLDTALVPTAGQIAKDSSVPAVDSAIARIAQLKDVGMDSESDLEYDRLLKEAESSPVRLVATSKALAGTEKSNKAMALGKRAIDQLGATPSTLRLYFPVVERQTIVSSARENGLDPVLVASLIRQESAFNPRATSPPGARGLMQLMPSVGQQVAAAKGISPWNVDMLYRPDISIRLGTAHLKTLFARYPEVVKILASYNAGEHRVDRWSTKAGAEDPEIFTERIPYVETRDYVRIILRNRAYYQSLYDW